MSWVAMQSVFGTTQKIHVSGADSGGKEPEEPWRDTVVSFFGGEASISSEMSSKSASHLTNKSD